MRTDQYSESLLTRRMILGGAAAGLGTMLLPPPAQARREIDGFVAHQMAAAHIPGLALGIARNGKLASVGAYGFADIEESRPVRRETMFHIASITKTVTATAVLLLVDDGKITLDERVAPHLDFVIAGEGAETMTFRHLLMHTSGISDDVYYKVDFRQFGKDTPMTIAQLVRDYLAPGGRYASQPNLKHRPGEAWDYSNIGFALLGYLVGRIAGQDMRELTRKRLFQPLGLRQIAWRLADVPAALSTTPYDLADGKLTRTEPASFPDWPSGMLRASIVDLTKLIVVAANSGASQGVRLLSEASTGEMLHMAHPAGLPDWLTGQGLAWQQSPLAGVPRLNHWGGDPGVFTMAYLDPSQRTAVVLLSNISATPETKEALKSIAAFALRSATA